jgi:hypothetical protein
MSLLDLAISGVKLTANELESQSISILLNLEANLDGHRTSDLRLGKSDQWRPTSYNLP